MRIRKAVIPAAGFGTRFLPATKAQPKEMLPIVDKPTIQYIVEEAVASGIEHIVIITGRSKRAIEDHFDKSIELELLLEKHHKGDLLRVVQDVSNLANVMYIRQKEPLGLGDAILTAEEAIGNEPFAVILGDDIVRSQKPALRQLMDAYEQKQTSIIGVQRVPQEDTNKYGIVKASDVGDDPRLHLIEEMVEKPDPKEAPSDLAILGRYIIQPEIFAMLRETPRGKGGEVQLTDALEKLRAEQPMYAFEFEGKRYDVGDKLGFLKATCEFALARDDLREPFRAYLRELTQDMNS